MKREVMSRKETNSRGRSSRELPLLKPWAGVGTGKKVCCHGNHRAPTIYGWQPQLVRQDPCSLFFFFLIWQSVSFLQLLRERDGVCFNAYLLQHQVPATWGSFPSMHLLHRDAPGLRTWPASFLHIEFFRLSPTSMFYVIITMSMRFTFSTLAELESFIL